MTTAHDSLTANIRLVNNPEGIEARCKRMWEIDPNDCLYLINAPRSRAALSWEQLTQQERNALTLSLLTVRIIGPKLERVFAEAGKQDMTEHLDQQLNSVLGGA